MGYDNIEFPRNTQCLVTGAAGFIGSSLVEALLNIGVKVRGLDNFSSGKQENINLFIHHSNFEFIEADIRDYKACVEACKGVDYIFHQAALGSVPQSIQSPLIYEENNVKGTHYMMEAARLAGTVKRFVFASSSAVYGDDERLPKIEGEEGELLSPYALTKAVNEKYGSLYTRLYNLPCIGLRYFNVFGKRQDPHSQYAAVIPIFVKMLKAGETPTIYGDGEQTRDFTYIENVIEANIKSCFAPIEACGQVYNVANGESITLNTLFMKLSTLIGTHVTPIYGPERVGDIKYSIAGIEKARKLLAYDPTWNFDKSIEVSLNWYQEYLITITA